LTVEANQESDTGSDNAICGVIRLPQHKKTKTIWNVSHSIPKRFGCQEKRIDAGKLGTSREKILLLDGKDTLR
jgi:hypothetical protein